MVESFDQSAIWKISLMCTPFLKAAKLDALLTECALKVSVLMPAPVSISLIQWVSRWDEIGLWGLKCERKSGCGLSEVSLRNGWVTFSYWWRHWTTHRCLSSENALKKHSLGGLPTLRFLVSEASLNNTPSGIKYLIVGLMVATLTFYWPELRPWGEKAFQTAISVTSLNCLPVLWYVLSQDRHPM